MVIIIAVIATGIVLMSIFSKKGAPGCLHTVVVKKNSKNICIDCESEVEDI